MLLTWPLTASSVKESFEPISLFESLSAINRRIRVSEAESATPAAARAIVLYADATTLMLANLDRANLMSHHRGGLALHESFEVFASYLRYS
jgi:hypothetical protein